MVKILTKDLTDAALDWAVAKAMYGERLIHYRTWLETTNNYWKGKDCSFAPPNEFRILSEDFDGVTTQFVKPYSTDWAQGGPIIERERIECTPPTRNSDDRDWMSVQIDDENIGHLMTGPTSLIAAMRCFVASKLGDEVEVPEELIAAQVPTADEGNS